MPFRSSQNPRSFPSKNTEDTSWEDSARWYAGIVGQEGHFYHQQLIGPYVKEYMRVHSPEHVLDIGCGSGILTEWLPPSSGYTGIDISPSLIQSAKQRIKKRPGAKFLVGDALNPLTLPHSVDMVTSILALQNMQDPSLALKNACKPLCQGGKFLMVLNHPCFRIPRQTSWGVDEQRSIQYRRIDLYGTSVKIPLVTHPGRTHSETTISFHSPLASWMHYLKEAGCAIVEMEELYCPKKSEGKFRQRENRARQEIPLFLVIVAQKLLP